LNGSAPVPINKAYTVENSHQAAFSEFKGKKSLFGLNQYLGFRSKKSSANKFQMNAMPSSTSSLVLHGGSAFPEDFITHSMNMTPAYETIPSEPYKI
jgi:hypothetical protein